MGSTTDQDTVPVPFIVAPTDIWEGDDGSWSTFAIQIGTPPQPFRILPATVGEEVWVPVAAGCEGNLINVTDCGFLRGADSFADESSRGFAYNDSNSWDQLGPFVLSEEQNLFGTSNQGLYGLDTVSLGFKTDGVYGPNLTNQVIAGLATEDFWLGSVGLGTLPGNFSGHPLMPTVLASMKSQNFTPSLAYGYTAGQSYASIPGSLILGGYDQSRISAGAVSVPIDTNLSPQMLQLNVQSIVATNTLGNPVESFLQNSIVANLDSSVSQLWLPQDVCDSFATAFGLDFDETRGLYTVNSSIHSQLQMNNPSITFNVGGSSGSSSTNIVFQYNAFDLNASIPIYNLSTPYFPIRRAANASQYTLGRVFLQEAYAIVDWERSNLTIGQAVAQNSTTDIVPILPLSQTASSGGSPGGSSSSSSTHPSSSHGLSGGAIAGIVICILAVIAIATGLWFFFRRRRRQRWHQNNDTHTAEDEKPSEVRDSLMPPPPFSPNSSIGGFDRKSAKMGTDDAFRPNSPPMSELYGEDRRPFELGNNQIHELGDISHDRELMGTPIMELPGEAVGSELDVSRIREKQVQRELGGSPEIVLPPLVAPTAIPRSAVSPELLSLPPTSPPLLSPEVVSPPAVSPALVSPALDSPAMISPEERTVMESSTGGTEMKREKSEPSYFDIAPKTTEERIVDEQAQDGKTME